MKKTSYKIIIVIALLFIALIPNFSNAAKVYVKKISKIWVSSTTSSEVKVKWKKVKKAKGYKVYVYNYSRNKYELYATTSKTNIKVKKLKSAKKYKFRVRAYKKKNGKNYYGAYSNSVTTLTAPDQVQNLKVTSQSDTTISLKWKKVKRATSYKVYVYNSSTNKYDFKQSSSKKSITLTGMNPAKSYKIKVRAYKKLNGKKYYGAYSQVLEAKTIPSKVTGVKEYDYSLNSVSLSWNKISNEATYKIYKYNSNNKTYESQGETKSTYFKVYGLNPASNYNFKVRAYIKINGENKYGAYSNIIDAGTCPNKASGVKIGKVTSNSLEVKWNKVKEATGYSVYIYKDSHQSFVLYKTTSNTSMNITGLSAAKFYKFYVKAYSIINGKKYYADQSSTLSHKTNSTNTEIAGIDVSAHNEKIDWEEVKKAGVDFAILRCGFGKNYKSQDDKYFERNLSECERLQIPYGVYIYSYALNKKDASSEADHVLRLLKGHKPKYGVWFDMEDADGYKRKNGMPSNKTLVNICVEFCEKMIKNGYKTGIYASLSWFNNQLKDVKLDKYEKWVAQWNDRCSYTKDYIMWQYTSSGLVDGIKGRTDMNIMYLKITDEPINQNTEEPKQEEPKTEEPKTEDPKTEDPKTEDPKTEDPKTEEPKTEEPKQEEPKQEEPNQEEPKQEEPKQEEPNQEEPNQEEPKQEEP